MMSQNQQSQAAQLATTVVAGYGSISKEQRDVALAAMLLKLGLLGERQLSSALSTWTLHGSVPLGEHLVSRGLLNEATLRRAEQAAAERLELNIQQINANGSGTRSGSIILRTLDALDSSGTVAKLLGVRDSTSLIAEEGEDLRQASVRYKLLRKLGQGGLGRVWLAFDENLKRHVAIKEIANTRDTIALQRFRREAEITGRLEHPGIVPIYELGEDTQSGEVFYAMRFLGKETLHDAILEYHERKAEGSDDRMLIRRLLTAFVSVCQAIGHAHSRKVIHRDLKPENVVIDKFDQVIVIDWGLAKVIDEVGLGDALPDSFTNDLSAQSRTIDGQVLGTPLYMSPEQAAGRLDELDERTDIYGLGAILYAILTGTAPHEQARAASQAGGARDLLSAIAAQPAPPVRSVNPDVPPALAAICERALSRRQYLRYETATQLADDIQRWMAGEPVSAYREPIKQQMTRWIKSHSVLSQAMAATMTVIVVSLVTMAVATRQNSIAQRQLRFDQMLGKQHEFETSLQTVIDDMTKDVQFMSTLPPILEIIDTRMNSAGREDEEIWRTRLNMIYEGLLHANPEYLSVTFFAAGSTPQGIVRVERHAGGASYVRRIPEGRIDANNFKDMLDELPQLFPGEVLLILKDAASTKGAVRLIGLIPVFNEASGELFGAVTIEADLTDRVRSILKNLDLQSTAGYFTDATGRIWVEAGADEGVHFERGTQNVIEEIPALKSFFSNPDRQILEDSVAGCIAARMQLNRGRPETVVAIVLQLEDGL